MNDIEREEARLARLLAAVRAEADPAVLAQARARLVAALELPRPFAWLGTPAALAGACAVLALSAGISFAVLQRDTAATHDTSLVSALIGDDGTYGLPAAVVGSATATDASVQDSGGVSP